MGSVARLASIVAIVGVAASPNAATDTPLSPRNASYTIDVRLDATERTLAGRETVTWRNLQATATRELWFHLYWNAWRNDRSTWMLEDRSRDRAGRPAKKIRDEDWGWIEVDSVTLLGEALPTRFAAPDDGNPHDRTVMVVELPIEVPPGESVTVDLAFRAKIPRTFARTGFRGDFYFFAHWFPILGVYETEGWNCRQYHAATEYYSDYGVYRVAMTVPDRFVLGATGRETDRRSNPDGTVTYTHEQADVHGFAWTASPDYRVAEERFEETGLPPVDVRLLYQPEHQDQVERHIAAARAALLRYGTWYGPYPYGHVTVVDPAWGSGAGGMEYPTLFTCGTRLYAPIENDQPESVTVHEAGHQFWYGIVGNDEFEHAWLDEGLNTFSTMRTLDATYEPRRYVRRYVPGPGRGGGRARGADGFFPFVFRDIAVPRHVDRLDRYRAAAWTDDPSTPTFGYRPETAADITYSKTMLWLATLERELGWDVLQKILSTFFARHAFEHPEPEDFFAVASEVASQDLSWFFDQVHGSAVTFDYAVGRVASLPVEPRGFVERDGKLVLVDREEDGESERVWRTEVVVERRGDGRFPVDVLLVYEDGFEQRERWDGRARHTTYVAERASKLRHAVVDPERKLLLDLDRTNDSRLRESAAGFPATKWAAKWMLWFQDFLLTMAFFA
jgi:hypothetical protein